MTPTKIYITTVGENEITVSINGEAAVTKTVKPTLTPLGNSKIRFQCDDIDETVLTYLYIFINGAALKATWIGEEDYLSVALFEAIMNKTFVSSSSPGSSGYLSYVAAISQASALVAPSVAELLNQLSGTVLWVRDDVGAYSGILNGAFTEGKTITGFGDWQGTATSWMPISDQGGTVTGYYTIWWQGVNSVQLISVDQDFVAADLFTLVGATKLPIKIEVYP